MHTKILQQTHKSTTTQTGKNTDEDNLTIIGTLTYPHTDKNRKTYMLKYAYIQINTNTQTAPTINTHSNTHINKYKRTQNPTYTNICT